jgi:mannan endo-1,4-beta-mannosidase
MVSYFLVWRNFDTKHHYALYPGHPVENNFRNFEMDPIKWFLEDLPSMYN